MFTISTQNVKIFRSYGLSPVNQREQQDPKTTGTLSLNQAVTDQNPSNLINIITIHMPQKGKLSSSLKCIFRKTRANRILAKQCIVFKKIYYHV